jgi:hypothetical protein
MASNLPLLTLLGFGTWYITNNARKKYEAAKKLTLIPISLNTTDNKNFYLNFQIGNASAEQFNIDALTANIYYKDTLIGTVYRKQPFIIKPTNNSLISFKIDLKSGAAIATALTLLLNKKEKYKQFKIIGAFTYFGLNFPINENINLIK